MALVLLSKQDDYDLSHSEQDCRGWTVRDTAGNTLGKVADLVIDTEAEHVDSIVLDTGAQIPAADVALRSGTVLVNGVGGAMRDTIRDTTTTETVRQNAAMSAAGAASTGRNLEGDVALPVIEERIRVGKRQVERGGVRVQQHVTEKPVEETVTLREEHVSVERRPVDKPLGAVGPDAFKEGVIEVTETSEEAVVNKQARVVEEVVVGKDVTERAETVRDTVKRTDVEVEQLDANTDARHRNERRS